MLTISLPSTLLQMYPCSGPFTPETWNTAGSHSWMISGIAVIMGLCEAGMLGGVDGERGVRRAGGDVPACGISGLNSSIHVPRVIVPLVKPPGLERAVSVTRQP